MSDTNTPPADTAIEALRGRVRQLDAEIGEHKRRMEVATACRDELAQMIFVLSRQPRARKPRALAEPAPEAAPPVEAKMSTRSPLFAVVPSASEPATEVA